MARHYPPHFWQEMIDRMLGRETVLTVVAATCVPEQTATGENTKHLSTQGSWKVLVRPGLRAELLGATTREPVTGSPLVVSVEPDLRLFKKAKHRSRSFESVQIINVPSETG